LNTTPTQHSIIHGNACFAYFNKIWDIPQQSWRPVSGVTLAHNTMIATGALWVRLN